MSRKIVEILLRATDEALVGHRRGSPVSATRLWLQKAHQGSRFH